MLLLSQLIFLLGYGPDGPPRKLFLQRRCIKDGTNPISDNFCQQDELLNQSNLPVTFSWKPVIHFLFWVSVWSVYVMVLCGMSVKQNGGMWEMFKRYFIEYFIILSVQRADDLFLVDCRVWQRRLIMIVGWYYSLNYQMHLVVCNNRSVLSVLEFHVINMKNCCNPWSKFFLYVVSWKKSFGHTTSCWFCFSFYIC